MQTMTIYMKVRLSADRAILCNYVENAKQFLGNEYSNDPEEFWETTAFENLLYDKYDTELVEELVSKLIELPWEDFASYYIKSMDPNDVRFVEFDAEDTLVYEQPVEILFDKLCAAMLGREIE